MAPVCFKMYDSSAREILGPKPSLQLLLEDSGCPFAHEAGVYIAKDNCLFITSNQFLHPNTGDTHIRISRVQLSPGNGVQAQCSEVQADGISLPNGGVNYKDGVIFCAQGTMGLGGGIAYMPLHSRHSSVEGQNACTYKGKLLVDSFHGRPFNSPNDVVTHSDGSIWFTDPIYGFEQGIRPRPRLPNQVYRFEPQTGGIRVVADGFGRPNGICFSADEKTCYITDTDWIHGDGSTDDTRASCIYAFDVATYSAKPFLTNRRFFAMADVGVPDGIKCDVHGNVYSGCGDGVSIWTPGGVLSAKILIDGGVANFCFGRDGEMFLLNENKLWRAQISDTHKGALLGI